MNDSKNPLPDMDELNARVVDAVGSHRRKLRVLTSAALTLGFIAVAVSISIAVFYRVMYWPKQKDMMKRAETAFIQAKGETVDETVKRLDKFMGVEILMTHVIS